MLPDSNVNEAASHGFVRFKISQKEGLGWGNLIENSALIYFDFNAPIHTPAVWHKVGQIYPWSVVGTEEFAERKPWVKIAPNPLTNSALLQIEDIEPGSLRLVLTNVSGREIREENTFGTSFEFWRNDLPSGLYFFQIWRNGGGARHGEIDGAVTLPQRRRFR